MWGFIPLKVKNMGEKNMGKNIVIYLWENLSDAKSLFNKIGNIILFDNINNDNRNLIIDLAKLIGKIDILFHYGIIKKFANDNIPEAMINILDQISLIYMNSKNGKINYNDIAKLESEINVLFDLIDNL